MFKSHAWQTLNCTSREAISWTQMAVTQSLTNYKGWTLPEMTNVPPILFITFFFWKNTFCCCFLLLSFWYYWSLTCNSCWNRPLEETLGQTISIKWSHWHEGQREASNKHTIGFARGKSSKQTSVITYSFHSIGKRIDICSTRLKMLAYACCLWQAKLITRPFSYQPVLH